MLLGIVGAIVLAGAPDADIRTQQARSACLEAHFLPGKGLDECVQMRLLPADKRQALADAFGHTLFGEAFDWANTRVRIDDWNLLTTSKDRISLSKKFSPEADAHKIWIRTEFELPQSLLDTQFLSNVLLLELDCEDRRLKILQTSLFEQNNLAGTSKSNTSPEPTWTYPVPGSIGERILGWNCSAAP